jgi:cardiolipin synthase
VGLALGEGTPAADVNVNARCGRVVPPNAIQPAGASFEGDPAIGSAQRVAIAREIVRSTLQDLVHRPVAGSAQLGGRMAERVAVRAREIVSRGGAPLVRCAHADVGADLGGRFGGPPTPARLVLLPSSEASIQDLLARIEAAARRIDLMMYGWQDDPTGREVAEALARAAGRGVRLRLLVDRTGFLIHNPAAAQGCPTFLDALAVMPNVQLIEPPGVFASFDHRKLAVFDGATAWTGGMIFTESARRRWHNLAFVAEGPIVAQYACVFEERWREVGGAPEGPGAIVGPAPPVAPNASVRLIQTNVGDRSLKDTIYHAVDHARHHIYLENPYFSDEVLIAKLAAAARRGVDVRAVLTLRGNIRRLNRYSTLTTNRLFRAGAHVYLFPAMTHVKAMSADGVWAYIGTGNYDELSLRNNREAGLSVNSPDVVTQLDQTLFSPDMAASEELNALLPPPPDRLFLEFWDLWY